MWQISNSLYLGDRGDACDGKLLVRHGITHVLNCAREVPCMFEGQFEYLALQLDDPDPTFREKLPIAIAFIDGAVQHGRVLVHCTAGVSRSPAVILAYLRHHGQSLADAARTLGRIVPTNPDESLLRQVAEYHGLALTARDLEILSFLLLRRI